MMPMVSNFVNAGPSKKVTSSVRRRDINDEAIALPAIKRI